MPPRKQIDKQQILLAAFEMAKEEGFSGITVRKLAQKIGCSTQPIYQEFRDMEELRTSVIQEACVYMENYINTRREECMSQELSDMIAYVEFARQEEKLFQLIFTSQRGKEWMQQHTNMQQMNINMIIYLNGLIMMFAYHQLPITNEAIIEMIQNAYQKFNIN